MEAARDALVLLRAVHTLRERFVKAAAAFASACEQAAGEAAAAPTQTEAHRAAAADTLAATAAAPPPIARARVAVRRLLYRTQRRAVDALGAPIAAAIRQIHSASLVEVWRGHGALRAAGYAGALPSAPDELSAAMLGFSATPQAYITQVRLARARVAHPISHSRPPPSPHPRLNPASTPPQPRMPAPTLGAPQAGEHLLALPQSLEPFVSGPTLSRLPTGGHAALAEPDAAAAAAEGGGEGGGERGGEGGEGGDGGGDGDASEWLEIIGQRTADQLLEAISSLGALSSLGAKQLAADVQYVNNILNAGLGISSAEVRLSQMAALLTADESALATAVREARDLPSGLAAAVAAKRGMPLEETS